MGMTREEKEQTGKYVLQMARLLEDGCYQKEMLLKAVHIIDEALEQTTKNDLGVDCISRADARSLICKIDIKHHMRMSRKTFKDLYNGIDELPPVTPQEPKIGHWVEQIDHEENCRTLICSNCDRPALHDEDSIWKHKFCPHCGAKMVEPQESEDK